MDKLLLDKLMHMAQLEITEEEQSIIINDLNKIIDFIAKLNEINTEHITLASTMRSLSQADLRPDIPSKSLDHDKALASAPNYDSNYFRVPQVKKAEETDKI